jgi:hypothetical protein
MTEKHGDPDIVEVRRVFDTRKKAIEWERKVIRRMGCISDKRWLNLANGGSNLAAEERSIRTRNNMSKSKRTFILERYGFEDYEEMKYFILYCINDGMTPNKIRQTYKIDGTMFDSVVDAVDESILNKNFRAAFTSMKTQKHRENISKSRKGIEFSENHQANLKKALSKVIDKRTETRQERYWRNKGFDSHDDAVKTIKQMYNDGTPIYKIAEELKIDPITVSKKVRLCLTKTTL